MPHHHHHVVSNHNRSFAIGVALNTLFVIIEASYGFAAQSLALIADAGHNLSDVITLLLAWGASYLATKRPTENQTYGLRKATVLASLLSAALLLVALGGIAWEAIGRLFTPQPVVGKVIIVVAAIGVVINTLTALLFAAGQKHDINIRSAYLHMAADAGISLGVVIAGVAILLTGWLWLDPLISLLIVLVILIGAWRLFKDSIKLSVDVVPPGIDIAAIKEYLTGLDSVSSIHDLHIWALSTSETALTVHLVTTNDLIDNAFLRQVQVYLHDTYDIEHATIQLENNNNEVNCTLDRPECL